MKMTRLLITALLAVALLLSLGSTIIAPNLNMFSAPAFTSYSTGFNRISPSQIGNTPIILAPSNKQLFTGGQVGGHIKPKLMTNNWTSSMKTSSINQMFALLARGIGNPNSP